MGEAKIGGRDNMREGLQLFYYFALAPLLLEVERGASVAAEKTAAMQKGHCFLTAGVAEEEEGEVSHFDCAAGATLNYCRALEGGRGAGQSAKSSNGKQSSKEAEEIAFQREGGGRLRQGGERGPTSYVQHPY